MPAGDERIEADAVAFNGDVAALRAAGAVPAVKREQRSLSASTWPVTAAPATAATAMAANVS